MPATAELRVYLLGPPKVEWADRALAIPRRQVRALLYRLAARLQPASREHLCFLFWPDTPESTGRRNLSHLLTHLRRALPAPELLLTPGDRVGLDPHQAWSDVVAFERLCATSSSHRRIEALQQAMDLYRGPFLASFSPPSSSEFEAWVAQEQRTWERLYLEGLADLIEEHAARGEYDAAIACAQRYLATDDLAEDVHRQLVGLYAAAGDRSAALRQFERCAAALERELGVSPLPATRAVYESVLEGRLPALKRSTARLTWATLPGPDVPLVGRDGALRHLEQAYAHVRAGQGHMVLISGEPGIGKSRLVQDFATHLRDQALILVGAGQAGGRTLPYQPVAQALRSVSNAEHLKFNVQPVWLAEASRLLPELRVLRPDLPSPMPAEPDEARLRLFEALCKITLGLASGSRSLLLCLDDLHRTDDATLDWLAYLGRQLRGSRLLILGTYRSEEAGAVDRLRHNLTRLGVLSELRLVGLDAASVLRLLRHLVGTSPGEKALAGRLQQATGGNPFFLLEMLRALIEAEQLPHNLADLENLPLPNTVRQAVEARLGRLSPKARQVLEAGAVLGDPFGFDLVHRTAGRREMETMDALDELVARHLLVEQPPGYRFQHGLIRRTMEAALGPVRRQLLHRRAGRALEQLEPHAVTALARHFDAGGEVEKALQYYAQTVQRAEELFAWREAERHQGRMLTLLDRLDPERSTPAYLAQRSQILTARAHLRFQQGRLADRDADLAALTALAEASGEESLRLQALIHQVRYLNLGGQYREAVATAEEGLALAKCLDDTPARCRLLAYAGFAHYFLGQPQPALIALESALALPSEETDPEMRGRITHILGYVYFHLGNHAQALAYHQEAYTYNRMVGEHNRIAWNLMDVGFLHMKLGHLAEARQHLTESFALARQIGARPAEAYALTLLSEWQLYRGDYVAAVDCFPKSLNMQQEVGSEHGIAAAQAGTGLACYHLGDLPEARRWLERAVEQARSISHRRLLAEALIGLGLAEIADHRASAAHRHLTEAVAVARESECRESLAAGLAALARAERKQGKVTSALSHAREAVRVAHEHKLPVCQAWAQVEVGLALLAQGDSTEALEHTARALGLVSQLHEAWIGSEEVHRAHARALRAVGHTEEADEQTCLADAVIETKASHIADPGQRRRYLQYVKHGQPLIKSDHSSI